MLRNRGYGYPYWGYGVGYYDNYGVAGEVGGGDGGGGGE